MCSENKEPSAPLIIIRQLLWFTHLLGREEDLEGESREWRHGLSQAKHKAACHFTWEERGHKKIKYTYCNQKKVWDLVDKMIWSSYTADSVIDKIYTIYGPLSITKIIKQIRNDEPNGGHPQLN
jgi:hypothetical protein